MMKSVMRALTLSASMFLTACGGGGGGSGQPVTPEVVSTALVPAPEPTPQPMPEPPASEPGPVVFIGDSITFEWTSVPGVNAGVPNETTAEIFARFSTDVLSLSPKVVVILGGTNDVFKFEAPTVDKVAEMADIAAASGACVILGKLPPIYIGFGIRATAEDTVEPVARLNSEIEMLAQIHGYLVADYHSALDAHPELFRDGLHPNAAGFEVMRRVVQPLIDECLSR